MIKKIIGIAVLAIVVIYGISFYMVNLYVPSGEEFDVRYTNLRKSDAIGDPEEEKYEFTKSGFFTRTNFVKTGDQVEYVFDIVNDGTLDAKLKYDPINLSLDQYFKKHIEYRVAYEDNSQIKKDDEIKAGETKTIRVTIKYRASDAPTRDSQFYETNTLFWFIRK